MHLVWTLIIVNHTTDGGAKMGVFKLNRTMKKITPYLYLAPSVFLVVIFCIYSDFFSLIISFVEWDGLNEMNFIGFENYIKMFQDPNFLLSSLSTLIWVVGTLLIPVSIALLFAIAITHVKTQSFFKTVFYLPNGLTPEFWTISLLIFTFLKIALLFIDHFFFCPFNMIANASITSR